MTKQFLRKKILEISNMKKQELNSFAYTLSLSPVNKKAKKFLLKALDLRTKQLQEVSVSPLAVVSEIDFDF